MIATQGHLFSEEVGTDLPLRDNGVHFYYEEDLVLVLRNHGAQRCGLRCGGRESRIAGDPRQITASLPPRKRWPLRAPPSWGPRVRRWRHELGAACGGGPPRIASTPLHGRIPQVDRSRWDSRLRWDRCRPCVRSPLPRAESPAVAARPVAPMEKGESGQGPRNKRDDPQRSPRQSRGELSARRAPHSAPQAESVRGFTQAGGLNADRQ